MKIGLADPYGAALWHYYAHGTLKAEGDSITEGIGQGRITANLEGLTVDLPYRIPDAEAVATVFDLLREEGLCLGASSGMNVAGAIRMARDLGPGPPDRHRALRLWHALPVEALQPRVPAREGPAGPGLARDAPIRHPRCLGGLIPRRGPAGAVLALLLLAGLVLAGLPGGGAQAQDEADSTGRAEAWAAYASDAEKIVADPDAPTEELEALRERLVAQRSEALAGRAAAAAGGRRAEPAAAGARPAAGGGRGRGSGDRRSCAATCTPRSPTRRRRCWRRRKPTAAPTR